MKQNMTDSWEGWLYPEAFSNIFYPPPSHPFTWSAIFCVCWQCKTIPTFCFNICETNNWIQWSQNNKTTRRYQKGNSYTLLYCHWYCMMIYHLSCLTKRLANGVNVKQLCLYVDKLLLFCRSICHLFCVSSKCPQTEHHLRLMCAKFVMLWFLFTCVF